MPAEKLKESTSGTHVYMRLRTESGRVEEIDAYITENGWSYHTSGDDSEDVRGEIVRAFHELY